MFKKYMHIERFGTDEVENIELGRCYVFPKLDGTNASTWLVNGEYRYLGAGSRNRLLTEDNDNAGFCAYVNKHDGLTGFHSNYRNLRLYGEWLVPHTLKTYREDVWRRFWIFDVLNDETDQLMSYEAYKPLLDEHGLDYIPPLGVITNGEYENFIHTLKQNNLFIKDGEGVGEGIVIKNYDFYNRFDRQVWAKIVATEFKEQHYREMGAPEKEGRLLEEVVAQEYVTSALVDKVYSKIAGEQGGWSSKFIPRLLETTFYDLVREELWDIVKKHKNPKINFKTLKALTINRIKELKPEVF
jgi:hypothetical protein